MRILLTLSLITVAFLSGWIASEWMLISPSHPPTRYEMASPIPIDRIAAAESWDFDPRESFLGMPTPDQ